MVAMVTLVASADVHHDVTTKVTYFDYSPYTYTYLDDNGVEQTASITDEATSAKQIIALLEKVYTDKTIPGIRYAYASPTGELHGQRLGLSIILTRTA